MKIPLLQTLKRRRGFTTLASVSSIAVVLMAMLGFNYFSLVNTVDFQSRAQVKQDYVQKEDAVLNALIHLVPNRAMGAMRQGSAADAARYSWESIFREALTLSNAEDSISTELLNSLGLADSVNANSGDAVLTSVSQVVSSRFGANSVNAPLVNGGNWWEHDMLGDARVGSKVPAPLKLSYNDHLLERQYPIISRDKTYTLQYPKGLGLSPEKYPLYNLIQYPDVRFGYKRPGEYFVGKRNWWVFSLYFGSHNQKQTGIPPVRKDYVLSIYEIPSQVPLTAATLLKVGKFSDGTEWENVSIDGSLVADSLQTEGNVTLTKGSILARRKLDLSGTTVVDGEVIQDNFDDLGQREALATQQRTGADSPDSNYYGASVGGNVGKVAFIPINRGTETLLNTPDGPRSARLSPTGWNEYSLAGSQARMSLEIRKMSSQQDQIPTEIRFTYQTSNGSTASIDYIRGSNWPAEAQPGGSSFPFQTEQLENKRKAIVVYLDRLSNFVKGLPNTGGLNLNHSLYIFPSTADSSVVQPSIPSRESDMAVSIRGGIDLTAYTGGLSLVSRYRVYIAGTLNNIPAAVPANSGLPANHEYYPPLSIFTPEKRFGEALNVINPVNVSGQLNSMKTGENQTVNPLEFLTGNDTTISGENVRADLSSLKSPAELPPIFMMNWLVTVEEIQ